MNKNYKNGNILSLTVKNFQTFTNQHFKFGPSLNLIAAPNGSGKSTIANAIAFAFNGTPRTIGKSKNIAEYIKFGCNEAEITVEMWYKENILKLGRKITATQNNYFINDSHVLQKRYFDTIEDMKIDVNNLCTFLPQERVGEFCKMEPKELFEEVIKNTNISMTGLKELYERKSKIEETIQTKEKQKSIVEDGLNHLESDMKAVQEQEASLLRLVNLEYKKDQIAFSSLKAIYESMKARLEAINSKIGNFEESIKTTKDKISINESDPSFIEYKKSVEILLAQNKELKGYSEELRSKTDRIAILSIDKEKIKKKILENEAVVQEKEKEKISLKNEFENAQEVMHKEIRQFKNKISVICSKPEYSSILMPSISNQSDITLLSNQPVISNQYEFESIIPSTRKIDDKIQEISIELSKINKISQDIQNKIEDLERQKQVHSGRDSLKMDMLKKYHFDTFKGVAWLRENKHLFKEEVLEPLYLHLEVDKTFLHYVESFLSFQALSSFIVMNEQDLSLLANTLKDSQGLGINIIVHSPCKSQGIPKEIIKKYKLDGVLSDYIECRQEYRDFLNNFGHFNSIPISIQEIDESIIYQNIPECRRMAIGNRYSEIKRSKYSNDYVIITNKLSYLGLFDFPKIDLDCINREMHNLQKERECNKIKVEHILEEKNDLKRKKEYLKEEFDTSNLTKLSFNLKRLERNLEFCKNQLQEYSRINHSQNLAVLEQEILMVGNDLLKLHKKLEDILNIENIPQVDIEKTKNLKLDIDNLNREIQYLIYSKNGEEEIAKSIEKDRLSIKNQLKDLKIKIEGFPRFEPVENLPETLVEIETEIEFIRAQLKLGKEEGNIKEEYNNKKGLLERISNDMNYLDKSKSEILCLFVKEKERLIDQIKLKIDPLNQMFMRMFERFDGAGRIELDCEQKDWELKILVKFRENEEFQQLSSFRQSGGEKSLTTVLFLLSLQQCESTPFRLVDEINQGMDPFNEKKVFEILGEMGDKSQFFIITPKLVKDLEFPENTTALIVYGGSGITKDIEGYCNSILV